jgi:acyl carrier protein
MPLTRDDLTEYIVGELGLDEDEFDEDTLLFSDGVLDSFSMMNIIAFMEKQAGIRVGATEVTLENLDSISRMMAYTQRKAE